MFRKLLIPLAAAATLAGCVTTAPYGYRTEGRGDYYYGRPSVDYRYHGASPYYGYPYYGYPYRGGFSMYYGYPYSRYPHYSYPYYGYPYYRPVPRPQPGGGHGHDGGHRPDGGAWRNLDEIRRRRTERPTMLQPAPSRPQPAMQQRPRSRADDGGSRTGQMIRRAREVGPASGERVE